MTRLTIQLTITLESALSIGAGGSAGNVPARKQPCLAKASLVVPVDTPPWCLPPPAVCRQHRQQAGHLVAGRPYLAARPARHRIGPLGQPPWRTRRPPTAPLAGAIEPSGMAIEDPLGIAPQQAIHHVRGTFPLDEVESAQSPSPWWERAPSG